MGQAVGSAESVVDGDIVDPTEGIGEGLNDGSGDLSCEGVTVESTEGAPDGSLVRLRSG